MSKVTRGREIEAHYFAMELLMPTEFLQKDLRGEGVDITDELAVEKLAKKYRVQPNVMAARLMDMMAHDEI